MQAFTYTIRTRTPQSTRTPTPTWIQTITIPFCLHSMHRVSHRLLILKARKCCPFKWYQ